MKEILQFQSDEGVCFDSREAAHNYELRASIGNKIKDLFPNSFSSNRADILLQDLLKDPYKLRDILTELIRKTRKAESHAA